MNKLPVDDKLLAEFAKAIYRDIERYMEENTKNYNNKQKEP